MSILKQQFVILRGATDMSWQHQVVYYTTFFILDVVFMSEFLSYSVNTFLFEDYWLLTIWTTVAGVKQNRYKTNNGCIKHLPQTGLFTIRKNLYGIHKSWRIEGIRQVWQILVTTIYLLF